MCSSGTIGPNDPAPPEITKKYLISKLPYVPGIHHTSSNATRARNEALEEYVAT